MPLMQAAEFVGWPKVHCCGSHHLHRHREQKQQRRLPAATRAALEEVRCAKTQPVPEHLRDAHYQGAQRLGHGQVYQYAHDGQDHFVAEDYLGVNKTFYQPTEQGVEKKVARNALKNGGPGSRKRKKAGVELPHHERRNQGRIARADPDRACRADHTSLCEWWNPIEFPCARWEPQLRSARAILFSSHPCLTSSDVRPLLGETPRRRQDLRPAQLRCGHGYLIPRAAHRW